MKNADKYFDCMFCLRKASRTLALEEEYNWYSCIDCNSQFGVDKENNKISRYVFWFNYKDIAYELVTDLQKQTCNLYESFRPNTHRAKIYQWDYIPNLTPQNIQAKMPTILTFL